MEEFIEKIKIFIFVFYRFSKYHGLAPFSYSNATGKFFISTVSTVYSLFFRLLIACILFSKICYIFRNWYFFSNNIEQLLIMAQSVLNSIGIIFVYFFQFYHRNRLVRIINETIEVHQEIYRFCSRKYFWDKKRLKHIRTMILLTLIQILNASVIVIWVKLFTGITLNIFFWTFIFLTFFILLSFYIGCGTYIFCQCFYALNSDIKFLTHRNGRISKATMQNFCEISDCLDSISILYGKCLRNLQKGVYIFSFVFFYLVFSGFFTCLLSVSLQFILTCQFLL